MKVAIVVRAQGMIPRELKKKQGEMEIEGKIETFQKLKLAWILWLILKRLALTETSLKKKQQLK